MARQIIVEAKVSPTTSMDLATVTSQVWPGPESTQFRAQWLIAANKPQEALVELEQIAEARKHDAQFFLLLSQACERVGLFDKADEYRTRAASISVDQATSPAKKEAQE
jgi:predicted Zn-dependent protease